MNGSVPVHVYVSAVSARIQREAVLRLLSLPIPLQVHMCFISRQAHRTVNSNSGLAWGYAQPEVEKDHRKKKNDKHGRNHLSLVLSPFSLCLFACLPTFPPLCVCELSFILHLRADSLSAFPLSVSVSHCLLLSHILYFISLVRMQILLGSLSFCVSFCLFFSYCLFSSPSLALFFPPSALSLPLTLFLFLLV